MIAVSKETVIPLIKTVTYEDKYHRVIMYKCQRCGTLHTADIKNYCDECGQKIKEIKNEL